MCGWMVFFKLGSLHLPSITMVSDIFPTQKKHKASPFTTTSPSQTANQKTQLLAVVPNCLYHSPLANKKKRKLEQKLMFYIIIYIFIKYNIYIYIFPSKIQKNLEKNNTSFFLVVKKWVVKFRSRKNIGHRKKTAKNTQGSLDLW